MKFLIKESKKIKTFSVIYDEDEYSFTTKPFESGSDFTSITIDTLQLEIDNEGKIVYVWGYYPLTQCKRTKTFPYRYEKKDLVAVLEKPPIPGVSISLIKNKRNSHVCDRWPIYINQERGWICIGNPDTTNKKLIQFAPDSIAALDKNSELIAVWLHPIEFPKKINYGAC